MKVSCVMPTFKREKYVPMAVDCFLQQDWPDKELIIIDDDPTSVLNLPEDNRITHIRLPYRTPTGTKRNIGAQAAHGSIIANWDDDDWSSAHRLQDEVGRLLTTGKSVTGYNSTVVYDSDTGKFYKNLGGPPYYASGTSQCYWKSWWTKHPYPDVTYGEDSVFSRTARLADELAIADVGKTMVARKHASNTDKVWVERLQPVRLDDAPWNFILALTCRFSSHVCSQTCWKEAREQFDSPVVEYKADWLPEVQTR